MTAPNAKVIADSISPSGDRLITLEIELHRFILPEHNTHRSLSRNFQSSRAIPILRQMEQIASNPAMPVWWGKDQSGMVAKEEITGLEREMAEMIILGMRDACLNGVKQLHKLGLHKQISNRYVEAWMWTKGVVTATMEAWEAFFALRCAYDAQPEIKALADAIYEAIESSTSRELDYGEYHLPYIDKHHVKGVTSYSSRGCLLTLKEAIKVSVSCCAQSSYRKLDTSLEKAINVYGMLNLPTDGRYPEGNPHFSPAEHVAVCTNEYRLAEECGILDTQVLGCSGNFQSESWWQYRKALEVGEEKLFIGETK